MNRESPNPPAFEDVPGAPPPPRRLSRLLWLAPLAAVAALGWGAWLHWERAEAAADTRQQAEHFVPKVRGTTAQRRDAPMEVTLPGATEAFERATVRARATGYVAERRVDIGSRVGAGDLLARLDAPDLEQQLAQAEAMLAQTDAALDQARARVNQARSDVELAKVTNQRTSTLASDGWAPRQSADNTRLGLSSRNADLATAQAGVEVAQANQRAQGATVARLRQLVGYLRIVAPFDGVVTTRNVELGDLVSADNGAGLFTLVRDDVLRVRINVPQSEAAGITDGLRAIVTVPELPGRQFEGHVARSSVALAAASRTLAVEVDVPNPSRALRPGLYVAVKLEVPRTAPAVVVPAEALVFDGQGMQVMVAAQDGSVRRAPASIRRDFGRQVELASGLQGGETVLLAPPTALRDGDKVQVEMQKPGG